MMEDNKMTEVAKCAMEIQNDKAVLSSLRSKIRWRIFLMVIGLSLVIIGLFFADVSLVLICVAMLIIDIVMLFNSYKKYTLIKSDIYSLEVRMEKAKLKI